MSSEGDTDLDVLEIEELVISKEDKVNKKRGHVMVTRSGKRKNKPKRYNTRKPYEKKAENNNEKKNKEKKKKTSPLYSKEKLPVDKEIECIFTYHFSVLNTKADVSCFRSIQKSQYDVLKRHSIGYLDNTRCDSESGNEEISYNTVPIDLNDRNNHSQKMIMMEAAQNVWKEMGYLLEMSDIDFISFDIDQERDKENEERKSRVYMFYINKKVPCSSESEFSSHTEDILSDYDRFMLDGSTKVRGFNRDIAKEDEKGDIMNCSRNERVSALVYFIKNMYKDKITSIHFNKLQKYNKTDTRGVFGHALMWCSDNRYISKRGWKRVKNVLASMIKLSMELDSRRSYNLNTDNVSDRFSALRNGYFESDQKDRLTYDESLMDKIVMDDDDHYDSKHHGEYNMCESCLSYLDAEQDIDFSRILAVTKEKEYVRKVTNTFSLVKSIFNTTCMMSGGTDDNCSSSPETSTFEGDTPEQNFDGSDKEETLEDKLNRVLTEDMNNNPNQREDDGYDDSESEESSDFFQFENGREDMYFGNNNIAGGSLLCDIVNDVEEQQQRNNDDMFLDIILQGNTHDMEKDAIQKVFESINSDHGGSSNTSPMYQDDYGDATRQDSLCVAGMQIVS